MKYLLSKKLLFITIFAALGSCIQAQEADSITFDSMVSEIIKNNPVLKQQGEKTNTALLKEELVKSAYKPNVYSSGAVSRSYPLPAFDFMFPDPETGEMSSRHFQMYPDFSIDYNIKLNQLIYDFGKTANMLAVQQSYTDVTRLGTEQLKDRLIITAAGWFYNLIYIQEALKIKTELTNTLKQHLSVIQKKQLTGSATQYEVLSTQVRISNIEAQIADLETSRIALISHLNYLMGSENSPFYVKKEIGISKPIELNESVYTFADQNRSEMLLARKNINSAELNVKVAKSGTNPTLSLFGSTGFKNGYLPEINTLRFNYIAGLNLNIPLFDSQHRKINTEIASSSLADSRLMAENTENQIRDEITEIYNSLQAAYQKIEQYSMQIKLATESYNHAKTNYSAGTITNLDLLDAANALSESELSLLKAKADFKFYEIKYKSATGKLDIPE